MTEKASHPEHPKTGTHKPKPEVYVLRDWKEYLGESFLIIFSVLLALVLTEYINNQREKKETQELLHNVKTELINNKKAEEDLYAYQKGILQKIDSDIYNNQARIEKVEEKVAEVLLSRESRKPENIHTTLMLMRDNYRGWAFDRAPSLIKQYQEAIDLMNREGY